MQKHLPRAQTEVWARGDFYPHPAHEGPAATMYREKPAYGQTGGDATPPAPATLTPPSGTPFTGMLNWLFAQIEDWRNAAGYTDTIGMDIAIIGPEKPVPDPNAASVVTTDARGGEATLSFKKQVHMGVRIDGEVGSDTTFTFFAIDTTSPYNDTRPPRVPAPWRCAATAFVSGTTSRQTSGATPWK